jgi:hypothetical protein
MSEVIKRGYDGDWRREDVLMDSFYVRDDNGCWVCKEI